MLARLSSIPHAISESISKAFNWRRRKSNDHVDEDPTPKLPLKPFKIQSVPSLVFEHVLHQMNPIELFELSNCSKKTRILIQRARLASHCDLELDQLSSKISITMKSGYKFTWCFECEPHRDYLPKYWEYYKYEKVGSIRIGGKVELLQNYKNADADTIYSLVDPCAEVSDYFFVIILSIFPCPIKTLTVHNRSWNLRFKNLFNYGLVTTCENLNVYCWEPNDFESLLRDIKVTKRVTINYITMYHTFHKRVHRTNLENLVNISELCLYKVKIGRDQLCTLNNEHLEFRLGSITQQDVKEFLMRWMDGKHERLKTLRCYFSSTLTFNPEPFLDGLKVEQHDPSDTRPCLVKFSDKMYIDCTTNMKSDHYRTFGVRNREGQTGTILLAEDYLNFVVWSHPVPPVEVPNGHILGRVDYYPIYIVTPRYPKVFWNETRARREGEGLLPKFPYFFS